MISLGISPQYFLDEMSFDEIKYLLKESTKREYEGARLICFFNLIAQGVEIKAPAEIIKFDWEKKTEKKGRKLNKRELENKEKEAKKWLEKTKQA